MANWMVCLWLFLGCVDAGRILCVFHFHSKSHFVMLESLAKGLAARGHEVTVVSHFPQKTPIPNYRDISLAGTVPGILNNVSLEQIYENWRELPDLLDFIWSKAGVEHCDEMYKTSVIRDLIKSDEKFDLLITELWGSDCFLPLSKIFRVPHISMITTMDVPWCLGRYGNPLNPSYHVNHFIAYPTSGLNFWQRVTNTLLTAYLNIGYYFRSELPTDEVVRRHLPGQLDSLSDIVSNSSLLFLNSHFSLTGSRPFVPNVIEVGGLHIPESKPLPSDIKTFLDGAKDGAIIFSLGSLIRAETLENEMISAFVNVFRSLPQRVLWKYNGTVYDQPENVKTVKWMPQSDVLAHPNVRMFITHGGLMGTQEAVAAGVPMLGIPFFADQRFNIYNYHLKGFAIQLELMDVTEQRIRRAVHDLLHEPRYRENAKFYSRLFLDRPQTPLETAVFWTEYVMRHNGSRHLRSAAADLSFVEYHLLDVLLFMVTILFIVQWVVFRVCIRPWKKQKID